MKFGFVDEHRHIWPVRVMCTALGLSVSGYYAWRSRVESPRAAANRVLLEDITRIHRERSGTYGSPRVHAVLRRRGRRIARSRIERLTRQAGLRGLAALPLPRRTRTTDSRHAYPIAPNRLGRNFVANRPGQVWLADLTYIPTGAGWLYLAAVLDLHTRKIVGRSMRETLHTEIALQALIMAIVRQRPAPGLIHHSDRAFGMPPSLIGWASRDQALHPR
jgi:putative transposase